MRATVGGVWLLLVLGTISSAQTRPMPTLPPEEPPTGDPTAASAVAAGEVAQGEVRRPWEYWLRFGAGWDSNIDFRAADGPSSAMLFPRGSVSHVTWSPRGRLRLAGTGSWIGYRSETDSNRYDLGATFDGSYRTSRTTTWRASGGYAYGYSDTSALLLEQGVLLPRVRTQTLSGDFGVTRTLGTRAALRLDARVYRAVFDEAAKASLGLLDGRSIRGVLGLESRIGTRNTASLEYSLESTWGRESLTEAVSPYVLTHFGSLQWTHVLSPRSAFLLEAGGSHTPENQQAGLAAPWSFFGGASYSRQVKRSSANLHVRREVVPAFGLGVIRLDTRFGLSVSLPMGRAWFVQLEGTYVIPETPEGIELSYSSPSEVLARLGRRIGHRFEVSAEGRYRRRTATGTLPEIDGLQATIFFSLVSPTEIDRESR